MYDMRVPSSIAWLLTAALAVLPVGARGFAVSYIYQLAAISGPLSSSAATLEYDPFHHELYVVQNGNVRVYNAVGMEVYAWPEDPELGAVWGVAPLEDGDILTLRYLASRPAVVRCNFRGDMVEEVKIDGLTRAFERDFRPEVIRYSKGKVYLASMQTKVVMAVDLALGTTSFTDISTLLDDDEKIREAGLDSFTVDEHGNLVVSVAAAFKVFVIAPDRTFRSFGRPGSAPGKFGIIKGVALDDAGRYYVSDRLKHAIIVFDREFNFLGEFGYRGSKLGSLVAPTNLVFAEDKLYVSQQGNRGVAVYQIGTDK